MSTCGLRCIIIPHLNHTKITCSRWPQKDALVPQRSSFSVVPTRGNTRRGIATTSLIKTPVVWKDTESCRTHASKCMHAWLNKKVAVWIHRFTMEWSDINKTLSKSHARIIAIVWGCRPCGVRHFYFIYSFILCTHGMNTLQRSQSIICRWMQPSESDTKAECHSLYNCFEKWLYTTKVKRAHNLDALKCPLASCRTFHLAR